jgi:hypothetical protein
LRPSLIQGKLAVLQTANNIRRVLVGTGVRHDALLDTAPGMWSDDRGRFSPRMAGIGIHLDSGIITGLK